MLEDPSLINPMVVIFRLAGWYRRRGHWGPSREPEIWPREPSSEKELYGLANVIGEKLDSDLSDNEVTGVAMLLKNNSQLSVKCRRLCTWLAGSFSSWTSRLNYRLKFLRHQKALSLSLLRNSSRQFWYAWQVGWQKRAEPLWLDPQHLGKSSSVIRWFPSQKLNYIGSSRVKWRRQRQPALRLWRMLTILNLIANACKEKIKAMKPLGQG